MPSGEVNGSNFGGGYLYLQWYSTPNVAGNYSDLSFNVCLRRDGQINSNVTKNGTVTVAGSQQFNFSCTVGGGAGNVLLYQGSTRIGHDAAGRAIVNISASLGIQITWSGNYVSTISAAVNADLGTIARGTSITSFKATSTTWNSITFSFTTADACEEVWVTKNGGANIGTGIGGTNTGSFTISGLDANTSYNWVLRVVRNSVWTNSNALAVSTKRWIQSVSINTTTLNVGDTIPLAISNPDSVTVNVYMYLTCKNASGAQTAYSNVITKNIGTPNGNYSLSLTTAETNTVYSTMKYSTEASLYFMVTSTIPGTSTVIGYHQTGAIPYKINQGASLPTLSTATMTLDSNTTSVVGNSTYLIQGISSVAWSAAKGNAAAKNGASLKSLVVMYGSNSATYDLTTSTTSFSRSLVPSTTGSYIVSTYVVDSRGLSSTAISKAFTVLSYKNPVIVPTVVRQINSGGTLDISFTASFSRLIVSSADKNAVSYLKYGYAELGKTPTAGTTLSGYTTSNASNGIDKTLSYSKTGFITLDANKNYKFVFALKDKLNEYTANVDVVDGNPVVRVLDSGQVGINCKPDVSNPSQRLRVNGSGYFYNDLTIGGTFTAATTTATTLKATGSIYEGGTLLSSKYAGLSTFNSFKSSIDTSFRTQVTKSYTENGITWDIYTITYNNFTIINAKAAITNIPVQTAWGGVYASGDLLTDFTFPVAFKEAPFVNISTTNYGNNSWVIIVTQATTTKGCRIQICRGSAVPNGTCKVYAQYIGLNS